MNRIQNIDATLLFVIPTLLFVFCVSSCDDTQLAKDICGAWEGNFSMSYSDQSKDNHTESLIFEKKGDKDGGTFIERQHIVSKNNELDYATCDYVLDTEISGTWEIIFGDIEMKYNVSSLSVEIEPRSLLIHRKTFDDAFDNIVNDAFRISDEYQLIKDAIQKDRYSELFKSYQYDGEGIVFSNVKIQGSKMTFEDDERTWTYHRK
ncbi:hypothetical protein ACQRD6_05705 [Prevotella sp. SGI.027]|nr:hypothetical protein [Prevotellaceae bacterium]MDY3103900.1 hypothetical protein [Prevotella sp.]MDY5844791.1 hypothetical protein [Prevotella sp.]